MPGGFRHILVPATRAVHDDDLILLHRWSRFLHVSHGVGRLERGNDSLHTGKFLKGCEGLGVGGVGVFDPALIAVIRMLRTYGRVVQTGADGVR